MLKLLHSALKVARYELQDSVRSRRFAVVLCLYLIGAMLACNGMISMLHHFEQHIARSVGLSASAAPGDVLRALWDSESFRDTIAKMTRNKEAFEEIKQLPLIAIFFGWLAFTFTPVFVILTSPSRIAEELATGSARFALVRTSRAAWCLGKFFGQCLEVAIALLLSAIGTWVVARFRVPHMTSAITMAPMIILGWKVWLCSIGFVGMSLGLSQLTRSPNLAIVFAFLTWSAMKIISMAAWFTDEEGLTRIWHVLDLMTPMGHIADLWRSQITFVLPAVCYVVALGLSYLAVGYAFFARKNV